MDPTIRLDHIALGLHRAADAEPLLEDVLGGRKKGGQEAGSFGFTQWVFAGGGRIEAIYPIGADGFLQRFLARGGPRVHHVTFKVSSLDAILGRAKAMGYEIAAEDRSDPYWYEAFLHPRQAQGIVVQLAQARPRPAEPAQPSPPAHAARVIGLRLRAQSADSARRQWVELLDAREARRGDELGFSWPDSPLTLAVDIAADATPGPCSIEVSAPRDLALPGDAFPGVGTRFVQR